MLSEMAAAWLGVTRRESWGRRWAFRIVELEGDVFLALGQYGIYGLVGLECIGMGIGRREKEEMAYHIARDIVPPRTRTWVKAPIATATFGQYSIRVSSNKGEKKGEIQTQIPLIDHKSRQRQQRAQARSESYSH